MSNHPSHEARKYPIRAQNTTTVLSVVCCLSHHLARSVCDEVLVVLKPERGVPPLVHIEHQVVQRARRAGLAVRIRSLQHDCRLSSSLPPCLALLHDGGGVPLLWVCLLARKKKLTCGEKTMQPVLDNEDLDSSVFLFATDKVRLHVRERRAA